MAENAVFASLKRKSMITSLNFWRTKSGAEIDFIIKLKGEIIPIEVKYSQRPIPGKSFYSFIKKYSPSRAFIITKNETKEMKIYKTKIIFIPIKMSLNNILRCFYNFSL